ncbi:MAG: zinc-ribbon domain-containing protein, partial [Atopobiaceae bacterium]|nr:zinc-ribbon domain-containing protein [Atopobiaceae bacterium]
MNCPFCGAPLPPNASFCPNCGHDLRQQPTSAGVPGQPAPQRPSDDSDGRPRPPFEQDEPSPNESHQPTQNGAPANPTTSVPRRPEGLYDDASEPRDTARQRNGKSSQQSHKLGGGAKAAIVVAVIMLLLVSLGIGILFVSFMGNFGTR